MENIIITVLLVLIVGSAIFYIWRAKKRGSKCIGCPMSASSSCHCSGNSKGKKD